MNTVDIVLALILVYGLVRGFLRGLLAEIASLVGIVAGIYGAIHFSHLTSDFLINNLDWNPEYVNLLAFAVTFIIIVFLISLAGKVLTKIAGFAALGVVNKMLGAIFGILKVAFVTSVIIMFFKEANETAGIIEDQTLEQSVLYEPVEVIAPIFLPSILKEVKERDILESEDNT
ncbi:CvpA family protein [Salegentibacter chungangensis]|uniref:CvpA family protein n=1 Tax=Salegentibacter chungangensis TaxID=1335724 RepID=A0ABW3NQD3_9FLAO